MDRSAHARRWGREGLGVLLLASACATDPTVVEAALGETFTLSAAASTRTFEATYCLEDLVWQSVAVSATFSINLDDAQGSAVTLRLLGDEATDDADDGAESGESGAASPEPSSSGRSVVATEGVATLSLQTLEDWSGVGRRCAVATVEVSANDVEGREIRLDRPSVQMSGFAYTRACEDAVVDADSFSVELVALDEG